MIVGCDQCQTQSCQEKKEWFEPCHDESELLATTTGSPNSMKCPNRFHRMKVQVATTPSHEEIGALVFCECERDAGK